MLVRVFSARSDPLDTRNFTDSTRLVATLAIAATNGRRLAMDSLTSAGNSITQHHELYKHLTTQHYGVWSKSCGTTEVKVGMAKAAVRYEL